MSTFLKTLSDLPGKVKNEFANSDSLLRSSLRQASENVTTTASTIAEAASDSTIVARREMGDATVAVGSLVARLATSVSGALRDGEFSKGELVKSIIGSPSGVSAAEAAAASAAASTEDDGETTEIEDEGEDVDKSLGRSVRLPRFLRPAHGAIVAFIGAGPVGLWTALQLKLLRPLWHIAMIERHEKYVRSHVLRVSSQSFERVVPHPEARAFVARLLGGRAAVSVRTTELERALRAIVIGLGVEFITGETVKALPLGNNAWLKPTYQDSSPSINAAPIQGAGASPLESQTSNANGLNSERVTFLLSRASVIVASDGARSPSRSLLFKSARGLRDAQSLSFMVHVRYEVSGTTSHLSALQTAAVFNAMGLVGEEYVGKPRGDPLITPCTLTLVVSEDMLGNLRRDSAPQGGSRPKLEDIPWTPHLRDAVRIWLNAKSDLVGEVRVVGSESVAVINLSVYRAEAFVTYASRISASQNDRKSLETDKINSVSEMDTTKLDKTQRFVPPSDIAFALVGDAAFGVPYYRALNNGLICGSELASALSEHGSASGNAWKCAESPPLEGYARSVDRLATQEIAAARLKAKAFAVASSGASAAHSLSGQRLALPAGSLVFETSRIDRWRTKPLI
jgi:2-polyprenyl-6-methoxyphenol hydroxylase-like FAD-dependent oxidoreductase